MADSIGQREAEQIAAAKEANSLQNLTEKELNFETIDDVQGIARDLESENIFNPDDNVILKNIFDGESTLNGYKMPKLAFTFMYNGYKYKAEGGQTIQLPGARAYLFVKHLVSLIYRRLEGHDELDKRTYPRTDKWVSKIVVRVDETFQPEGLNRDQEHQLPDYYEEDAKPDADGLSGRLGAATNQTGGGEVSLGAQLDDAEATDEQIDKIPDFDPSKNPNVQFDGEGKPIDTSKKEGAAVVNQQDKKPEVAFPGAKQSGGKPAEKQKANK